MAKNRRMVDYGYKEPSIELEEKGTLLVLDAFADVTEDELGIVLAVAKERRFERVVLFPHNEKTLATLKWEAVPAYHKRVKALDSLLEEMRSELDVRIDTYEEKRKKYTPMELILRYAEETYRPPYFLYLRESYANAFAGFASFEECIRKVRLIVRPETGDQPRMHPKLEEKSSRWDFV